MNETWAQIIALLAGVLLSAVTAGVTLYIRNRTGQAEVRQMNAQTNTSTAAGVQEIYQALVADLQKKMVALEIEQRVEKGSHETLVKALYMKIDGLEALVVGLERLVVELRDEIKTLTREKEAAEAKIEDG